MHSGECFCLLQRVWLAYGLTGDISQGAASDPPPMPCYDPDPAEPQRGAEVVEAVWGRPAPSSLAGVAASEAGAGQGELGSAPGQPSPGTVSFEQQRQALAQVAGQQQGWAVDQQHLDAERQQDVLARQTGGQQEQQQQQQWPWPGGSEPGYSEYELYSGACSLPHQEQSTGWQQQPQQTQSYGTLHELQRP